MTTLNQGDSQLMARSLFLEKQNVSRINRYLRLPNEKAVLRPKLLEWYDLYMCQNRLDSKEIGDPTIWASFMTEMFVKDYKGRYPVDHAEIPFLPYETEEFGGETGETYGKFVNKKNAGTGRWPGFKLVSAVEDGVGDDGCPVVHGDKFEHVRMFTKPRPWRWGQPVPGWMRKQTHGMRLVDRSEYGSLVNWELLNRPHPRTGTDMSVFLSENVSKPIPRFSAV